MEFNLQLTLIWVVIFQKIRTQSPKLELGLIELIGLNEILPYIKISTRGWLQEKEQMHLKNQKKEKGKNNQAKKKNLVKNKEQT